MSQNASLYSPAEQKLLAPFYRSLFLGSMFVICSFNFADRAVMSVLAQSVKVDMHLTDLQIGLVQGSSFGILYALLGIPFGRLAERANRLKIIVWVTAIWSVMTALCGVSQNFIQILLARIGVGMGEAGFIPPTSSLVADHFPARRRASAMSIVMLGTPVGTFGGALIAGWAADAWSWRAAFMILGLPGVAAALFVWFALKEPPRGLVDNVPKSPTPPPNLKAFFRELSVRPAFRYVIIGGALAGFGMTSISGFLAIYLARVLQLSTREAGALFGTISGVSIAIGLLIGAFTSDWLAQRDKRWSAWIATLGLTVAPFVYFVAFGIHDRWLATVMLTAAAAVLLLFYAPTLGMIQNLLEPKMRATGVALFSTLYTLVGAGLGGPIVGLASDRFARAAFGAGDFEASCPGGVAPKGSDAALIEACRSASAIGIQHALTAAVCVFFLAAIAYFMASRTLRQDLFKAPT
ncbi:MAG TPA: MFS transporter [Steroidobacteraceae bacterium]|nr:MFS transporter [Steroidobacteraceae bacterium]